MEDTQRRFSTMGDNLFKIANKMCQNQSLCRLLKYQTRQPFSSLLPDLDGDELLHKQILVVPKIPENDDELVSFVVARFDRFIKSEANPEFKTVTLRFDIACPYEEWALDGQSMRPYLIMAEIDKMFNGARLAGIGKVSFVNADPLILTPQIGGYSMVFMKYEFN